MYVCICRCMYADMSHACIHTYVDVCMYIHMHAIPPPLGFFFLDVRMHVCELNYKTYIHPDIDIHI